MDMKALHMITFTLVIIGAINWGLVGLFNINLVNMLVGAWPMVEKIVYIAVGASAIVIIATHQQDCKNCMEMSKKGKK